MSGTAGTEVSDTDGPCRPLEFTQTVAADQVQRVANGVVANSDRAAGGLSIPLTAPAGRCYPRRSRPTGINVTRIARVPFGFTLASQVE
jgi:hypothetical protein